MNRATLIQYLAYNEETNVFTWLPRTETTCPSGFARKQFNTQFAGKEAGFIKWQTKQRMIMIKGKTYDARKLKCIMLGEKHVKTPPQRRPLNTPKKYSYKTKEPFLFDD